MAKAKERATKVCIVTGSRADYGLLKNLMHTLCKDPDFNVRIAVTGPHLCPAWGETYQEIVSDGFKIDAKIETLLSSNSARGMGKSLGLGVISFTDYFARRRPDFLILQGDRIEILAAAQAAYTMRIPIVHLHGGEVTSGSLDDYFRHAITKCSNLHFVTHEMYAKRVVQMGEHPETVYVTGAIGLDRITKMKKLSKAAIANALGIKLWDNYMIVSYHPATASVLDAKQEQEVIRNIWTAASHFPDHQFLISLANTEPTGYSINKTWKEIASQEDPERIKLFYHFGSDLYLNVVSHCDAVIGNSSSGVIEVPYFQKPTVNIGSRQDGRYHPSSVLSCDNSAPAITDAIHKALDEKWYAENVANFNQPFGAPGEVVDKVVEVLKRTDFSAIKYKRFYLMD